MSFAECTARSISPASSATSISLEKSPLPPASESGLSRILSPEVLIGTISVFSAPDPCAAASASRTAPACQSASRLPRVPTRIMWCSSAGSGLHGRPEKTWRTASHVVLAERIEGVHHVAVRQRAAGMHRVRWDDTDASTAKDGGPAGDGHLELALVDMHDLFMHVAVLWEDRALVDVPQYEGHVRGVREFAVEAGNDGLGLYLVPFNDTVLHVLLRRRVPTLDTPAYGQSQTTEPLYGERLVTI